MPAPCRDAWVFPSFQSLFRSFYNTNFTRASRGIRSFCISRSIDTFIKYFGVFNKNSPVLPDKIVCREKNVSRETFTMRSRICVPQLCRFSILLLWFVLRGRWRNDIGLALAGGAPLRYGARQYARLGKMGVTSDTIKFLLFINRPLSHIAKH
jgi:hypothetical protein